MRAIPAREALVALLVASLVLNQAFVSGADPQCPPEILELGRRSAVESARARGYQAQVHNVVSKDGYIISLVKITNPLIRRETKEPLLFVHGMTAHSKAFLTVPGKSNVSLAKNYANLNASRMSEEQLKSLLVDDPAGLSLVWTALNFGHTAWMLDLRGAGLSIGHIDPDRQPYLPANGTDRVSRKLLQTLFGNQPTTVRFAEYWPNSDELDELAQTTNPKYWNYSIDDIVKYDIPAVSNYVIRMSRFRKLIAVGHSAGTIMLLAALSETPTLANKFRNVLIWAPAMYGLATASKGYVEHANQWGSLGGPNVPLKEIRRIEEESACALYKYFSKTGGSLTSANLAFAEINSGFGSLSGRYLSQVLKISVTGNLHYFDYGNERDNGLHYGQAKAPAYNVSRITSKVISVWGSTGDEAAPMECFERLVNDLPGEWKDERRDLPAQVATANQIESLRLIAQQSYHQVLSHQR